MYKSLQAPHIGGNTERLETGGCTAGAGRAGSANDVTESCAAGSATCEAAGEETTGCSTGAAAADSESNIDVLYGMYGMSPNFVWGSGIKILM